MLEKLFWKSTPILAKIPIICLKLFIIKIPPMILLECVSKIVLESSTILYNYNPFPRNVPLTQVFYIRLNYSCLKYFKKSILSTVRMLRITSKVKNVFLPLWNWKLKDTLHLEHHFHFISVISLHRSDKKNFCVSFLEPFICSNFNHLVTRSLCT